MLLLMKRSHLRYLASCLNALLMPSWGDVPDMTHRAETLGKTQDTLEKRSLPADLGTPLYSPKGDERHLLFNCCPHNADTDELKKMDEWTNPLSSVTLTLSTLSSVAGRVRDIGAPLYHCVSLVTSNVSSYTPELVSAFTTPKYSHEHSLSSCLLHPPLNNECSRHTVH